MIGGATIAKYIADGEACAVEDRARIDLDYMRYAVAAAYVIIISIRRLYRNAHIVHNFQTDTHTHTSIAHDFHMVQKRDCALNLLRLCAIKSMRHFYTNKASRAQQHSTVHKCIKPRVHLIYIQKESTFG